jgi:hypothetical protein
MQNNTLTTLLLKCRHLPNHYCCFLSIFFCKRRLGHELSLSCVASSLSLANVSSLLLLYLTQKKMQRAMQAIGSHGSVLKSTVLRHISAPKSAMLPTAFSRLMSVSTASLEERGFETATVADVLKSKGKAADGSWLWCTTEDTVYDAVKSVCIF